MRNYSSTPLRQKNRTKYSRNFSNEIDILKYTGLLISILGVLAWITGTSFNFGYWAAAGYPAPPIQKSIQLIAFLGFIEPLYNWMAGALLTVITGLYVILMSARRKRKHKNSPEQYSPLRTWISSQIEFDRFTRKLGASIGITGVAFFLLLVVPLALWILAAILQGHSEFEKEMCSIRRTPTLPTIVTLGDGKAVAGKILDLSDKFIVLVDYEKAMTIGLGEKPQIITSTSFSSISCKENK